MSLLMAERFDPRAPTLFGPEIEADRDDGVGGGPTLDETIVGAWEGLTAQVAVACPLCEEGTLRPLGGPPAERGGSGRSGAAGGGQPTAAVRAGGCDRCGAQLA